MTILLLNLSLLHYLTGWKIFKTIGKIVVWLWVFEQFVLLGILGTVLTKLF